MDILRFNSKEKLGCDLCDKCCIYRGDIRLTGVNICQISKYLNLSPSEFCKKYTYQISNDSPEIALKAIGEKKQCIMYQINNRKCKIHKVKPMQCVMFPLVPENLKRDYFYNQGTCECKDKKLIKVKHWLNGNNGIYKKNKKIYLEWIVLIEDIEMKWKYISEQTKLEIKKLLFENYNLKFRNYKAQVKRNIKEIRKVMDKI